MAGDEAVEQNERCFGEEARAAWGDEAVDAANARLRGMSQERWNELSELGDKIIDQLKLVMAEGNPTGEQGKKLARMHAEWVSAHWGVGSYTPEAHLGLVRMYLSDERFSDYYDSRAGVGATRVLVAAIEHARV